MPLDVRSISLFVLATVACVFMLKHMEDVLVPIVLGALIFYALAPGSRVDGAATACRARSPPPS